MSLGVVIIGRNEGERLTLCLESALKATQHVVYVDSGSSDDSVGNAKSLGALVVSLDLSLPFTAARARNIGWRTLLEQHPEIQYLQFVDGDCELCPEWIPVAREFLENNPEFAVTCGRRLERYPQRSIYNQLCDIEWNTPIGEALACGGDAMFTASSLVATNGYRDDVIAGEEPELCVRLRQQGKKIQRLEQDMTLHDANITQFKQWWKRTRRCGFAFALGKYLHGAPPERHWVGETRRALLWGAAIPLLIIGCALITPWALILTLVYPLQVLRLFSRSDISPKRVRSYWALLTVVGKIPEALGAIECFWKLKRGQALNIIEYK